MDGMWPKLVFTTYGWEWRNSVSGLRVRVARWPWPLLIFRKPAVWKKFGQEKLPAVKAAGSWYKRRRMCQIGIILVVQIKLFIITTTVKVRVVSILLQCCCWGPAVTGVPAVASGHAVFSIHAVIGVSASAGVLPMLISLLFLMLPPLLLFLLLLASLLWLASLF